MTRYGACIRKKAYKRVKAVKTAVAMQQKETEKDLRFYRCPYGHHWHTTHWETDEAPPGENWVGRLYTMWDGYESSMRGVRTPQVFSPRRSRPLPAVAITAE